MAGFCRLTAPLGTLVLAAVWVSAETQNRPPVIIDQPVREVYFVPLEASKLACVAKGDNITYSWTFNELPFRFSRNDPKIFQLDGEGTIIFTDPDPRFLQGRFQCFAENELGTAVTAMTYFREAILAPLSVPNPPGAVHRPAYGNYERLKCDAYQDSVPEAKVFWSKDSNSGRVTVVQLNDRVTMDGENSLIWVNFRTEDNTAEDEVYRCRAMNDVLRRTLVGTYHIVQTSGSSSGEYSAKWLWTTPSKILALRGEPLTMKCIAVGYPTPEVTWTLPDGRNDSDRVSIKWTELTISYVDFVDAGLYECTAHNELVYSTTVTHNITVTVEAAPYFQEDPKNIETTKGSDVVFLCDATGIPKPQISWYINGVPFDDVKDPRFVGRLKLLDAHKLGLSDVTLSDHMVAQCNASNVHGFAWANMYLFVTEGDASSTIKWDARKEEPNKDLRESVKMVSQNCRIRLNQCITSQRDEHQSLSYCRLLSSNTNGCQDQSISDGCDSNQWAALAQVACFEQETKNEAGHFVTSSLPPLLATVVTSVLLTKL